MITQLVSRTERYFVQREFVSTGIGEPVRHWVTSNETQGMTADTALALAGDDPGNRAIHEVVTRSVVKKGNPVPPPPTTLGAKRVDSK